jgi:hypothetical protein
MLTLGGSRRARPAAWTRGAAASRLSHPRAAQTRQGQIEKEVKERNVDPAAYSASMIVKTSAPTELGSLRKADGDEGFAATAK